ncbi:ABC transporter substrate-binding protein, partial [Candidatus Magnetomorum sp. HK-1]
ISTIEYNAQNDSSLINQIIDKLSINKPNMIYVLGTPIAQAIQKRLPDVLLVQGTATDPVSAGLADSWNGSGKNYVATTDLPPVHKQIQLIKSLTPNVKKLGVIYNPGEINSVSVIKRFREFITKNKLNITLVERPISNTSEVATVMNSLIGNADAIYLPPDNTAHAAIPVIGRIANENKQPFYATVSSAIDNGALATLSLNFYKLGEETAFLALRVLNGENPAKIPITPIENPEIIINKEIALDYLIDISKFLNKPNIKIVN